MKQYIEILSLAEQNKLPNKIDDSTNIPLHIFNELIEADYIKAIVSKTLNPKELGFLDAKITSKGREYLHELKKNSHLLKLAETKHTQQGKEKKSKLSWRIGPLLKAIIVGLIVGAIVVFVFQPWQQKIQSDKVSEDEGVHQGQKPDAASSFQDRLSFIEAAKEGNVSVIESLLDKGVDVNTIDRDGNTALIEATRHGQRACVQKLLKKGSDVETKNNVGWTALIIASQNGHKAIVELLIKNNADVNAKASNGGTALVFASYKGYDEIVDILKTSGAVTVRYPDPKILHAAFMGDINTLKALLEKGVSPNTIDRIGGETPLMYAMGKNHVECAKLLLEFGADVNIRDKDGHTVFDDVKGKPEMLELIEKYDTKRQ